MKALYKFTRIENGFKLKADICVSEDKYPIRYKIKITSECDEFINEFIIRDQIDSVDDIVPFRTKVSEMLQGVKNDIYYMVNVKWKKCYNDTDRLDISDKVMIINSAGFSIEDKDGETLYELNDEVFTTEVLYGLYNVVNHLNNKLRFNKK